MNETVVGAPTPVPEAENHAAREAVRLPLAEPLEWAPAMAVVNPAEGGKKSHHPAGPPESTT